MIYRFAVTKMKSFYYGILVPWPKRSRKTRKDKKHHRYEDDDMDFRLVAVAGSPRVRRYLGKDEEHEKEKEHEKDMDYRFVHVPGMQGDKTLKKSQSSGKRSSRRPSRPPALLISYAYLRDFLKHQKDFYYRDWVMDSGAFTAWRTGLAVDLQEYIDCCHRLLEKDKTLVEVYGLDVIHDPEGTTRNIEEMWRQGIKAIPTYHIGSPEEVLIEYAKKYPKIAVGGVALARGKKKEAFAEQVFARVWPKRIHGFAAASEEMVLKFPWDSVDAASWEIGPCGFGNWRAFGGRMSIRGSDQNLRAQVEYFLDLEEKATARWAPTWAKAEKEGGLD